MAANPSVEFLERLVSERFQAFSQALAEMLKALVGENKQAKLATAQHFKVAVDQLKAVVSSSDVPDWLKMLSSDVDTYVGHASSNNEVVHRLMNRVLATHRQIIENKWNFREERSSGIDFNSLYQQALANSKVSELFDQLIGQLQKIIDSNEVDSRKAQEALENLVATLKRNARSDYLSARGAWEFSRSYLKNVLKHVATEAPGIKHLVKPLFTTIDEMNIEWGKVHTELREKVALLGVSQDMPMLEYSEKAVLMLPGPDNKVS